MLRFGQTTNGRMGCIPHRGCENTQECERFVRSPISDEECCPIMPPPLDMNKRRQSDHCLSQVELVAGKSDLALPLMGMRGRCAHAVGFFSTNGNVLCPLLTPQEAGLRKKRVVSHISHRVRAPLECRPHLAKIACLIRTQGTRRVSTPRYRQSPPISCAQG